MENVLNRRSRPETVWTTVNTAEALPGVLTPLGWTFWEETIELAVHGAFYDIGAIARRDVVVHPDVDERTSTVFFGRYVGNVDTLRRFADRMPGTSGDAWEEQVFGAKRQGVSSRPSRARYPMIALKMPLTVRNIPRRLAALREASDGWWRAACTAPPATVADATALLVQAQQRFQGAMQDHVLATFLCQGMFDQVSTLAKAAGKPGLELRLTTGYGGLEESLVLRDMWEASRGRLTLDDFVARHGYHGPSEGEISNPSWREDPGLLKPLLELYAGRAEEGAPAVLEEQQRQERVAAEAELLAAASGPLGRARTRLVLRMAARHITLREVGKAAFLRTIDAGRIAARVLGELYQRDGRFDDPDDVFYLTAAELAAGLPDDAPFLVAQRRELRREYEGYRLPQRWVGQAEPLPAEEVAESAASATSVQGLPVSPGVVEGRARVILDPTEIGGFDAGDVLVCTFTDPSWAPLLNLAGALVIDIGGPMSHGAIVARELGIPAVINTGDGTSVLRSGDLVRVNAGAGVVDILERAERH
jgi:phosphohistidine swiveling domain-containing protein